MRSLSIAALIVVAGMTAPTTAIVKDSRSLGGRADVSPRLVEAYCNLPLAFEENRGQTDDRVRFSSRGLGHALFLTPTEVVLSLPQPLQKQQAFPKRGHPPVDAPATVLRMHFAGANPAPAMRGVDELSGKSNYFVGSDKRKWKTGVRQYEGVMYEGVYPGINVKYYGNQRQLEHDFIVGPGADAGQILFRVEGAESTRLNDRGDLVFRTFETEVVQRAPLLYQDIDGARQLVEGSYQLRGDHVGFAVGAYDRTRPLVIDPVLSYSTYLGGNVNEEGWGIAVDGSGNTYVTGLAYSLDFPTVNPIQGSHAGGIIDVFVTKLNATGSALVYSTYLGGSLEDFGSAIAVDASGNAYLTGTTASSDFPTMNSLKGPPALGFYDAFVTKLNATGSALVYSTYLGGGDTEYGNGIAVDASGHAYVTGFTLSTDFPVASAFQAANAQSPWGFGTRDAFVTKLNATGSAFVYSTYLGGNSEDEAHGIAVDASGNAYVTGNTWSDNFPTASPVQAANVGNSDVFVAKLNASGASLAYSTYLGGFGVDSGQAITVDASGSAYVTGWTSSTTFPLAKALQGARGSCAGVSGCDDAFVSKLSGSGSTLVYSTYLGGGGTGGRGSDRGYGIAVDAAGSAYVTGSTTSLSFPMASPIQGTFAGGEFDVFVSKLNPAGSALSYSTYLGGDNDPNYFIQGDIGAAVAVDGAGNAYVTGFTTSTSFPTAAPYQATNHGLESAFVAKISAPLSPVPPTVTTQAATAIGSSGATLNGSVNPNGSAATRVFDYGTTTSYGSTTSAAGLGAGVVPIATSSTVTGLGCATLYHFRARASNANGSTNGGDLTFTTSGCQPVMTLSTSANPSIVGQLVTFTATLTGSGPTPTGTVQFKNGGVNVGGPVALSGGVAVLTVYVTSAGARVITADYSGDAVYLQKTATLPGGQVTQNAAPREYVSVTGNDLNACSNPATPCRTFTGAITQVTSGGEIVVLSSGTFGGGTINKSVTINAPDGVAVLAATPIVVSAGPADIVTFRGITFVSPTPGSGAALTFSGGAGLNIERCVLHGWNTGLVVQSAGKVNLTDTVLRDNATVGVSLGAGTASIERSRLTGNGTGLHVQAGASAAVKDSVVAANGTGLWSAGVMLDVEDSVIANNAGAGVSGSAGTTRISGSTVTNNLIGLQQSSTGVVRSRGANTIEGNGTNTVGAITPYAAK